VAKIVLNGRRQDLLAQTALQIDPSGKNKESMDHFMQSDLVKAIISRPFLRNVASIDYSS